MNSWIRLFKPFAMQRLRHFRHRHFRHFRLWIWTRPVLPGRGVVNSCLRPCSFLGAAATTEVAPRGLQDEVIGRNEQVSHEKQGVIPQLLRVRTCVPMLFFVNIRSPADSTILLKIRHSWPHRHSSSKCIDNKARQGSTRSLPGIVWFCNILHVIVCGDIPQSGIWESLTSRPVLRHTTVTAVDVAVCWYGHI